MKTRRKQKSILGVVLLWLCLLLLLPLAAVALYGYFWMQSYLQGPEFGVLVARELGAVTKSRVDLEGFTWADPNAYVATVTLAPKARQGWHRIKGDSIEAGLDWSAVRSGVWSIPRVTLGSLEIDLGQETKGKTELPDAESDTPPSDAAPAWLKRWLPDRTEIGEILVERFHLLPGDAVGVTVKDMEVTAKPGNKNGSGPTSWALKGRKGELTLPNVGGPFLVSTINARLDESAFTVNDGTGTWIGGSEITSRGVVPFGKDGRWHFEGHVGNLDVDDVLSPFWRQKVSGQVHGDYQSSADGLKGNVQVKNAVVQNMDILNRVAEFTRTDRFRRLVFDTATADVQHGGGTTRVRNLVLQSNGLLRVEGGFTTNGRTIQGTFEVGVTADALRWIPGSQSRVFTETRSGSPGLVWTTVKISGPVDQPREDLSNRLLAALGKALILDAPLGAASTAIETGVGVGGKVIEGGADVLKGEPTKAVEKGVEMLKDLVPLFGK